MSSPAAASPPGGAADASVEALVPCLGSLSLTNSTTVPQAKLKDEIKHQEPFQERNISDDDRKVRDLAFIFSLLFFFSFCLRQRTHTTTNCDR